MEIYNLLPSNFNIKTQKYVGFFFFFQDTLCKTSLAKKEKAWTIIIRTDGTNISQYCINWMMNEEDKVFDYTVWKI